MLVRGVVAALVLVSLSACGSDDGDPAATPPEPPRDASVEDFCTALNRVYYSRNKTADDLLADAEALLSVGTPSGLDEDLRSGVAYFADRVADLGRQVTPDDVSNIGDSETRGRGVHWHDLITEYFESECEQWQSPTAAREGAGAVEPVEDAPAEGPGAVVGAYYAAYQVQDCAAIVSTLSQRRLKEGGALCETEPDLAFEGSAETIAISGERIDGDRALVDGVETQIDSGETFQVQFVLVVEDGAWKINEHRYAFDVELE